MVFDLLIVRAVFILLLAATAFFLTPFRLSPPSSACFGLGLGLVAVASTGRGTKAKGSEEESGSRKEEYEDGAYYQ